MGFLFERNRFHRYLIQGGGSVPNKIIQAIRCVLFVKSLIGKFSIISSYPEVFFILSITYSMISEFIRFFLKNNNMLLEKRNKTLLSLCNEVKIPSERIVRYFVTIKK